jgi:hypothetical protein
MEKGWAYNVLLWDMQTINCKLSGPVIILLLDNWLIKADSLYYMGKLV